MKKIFYLTIILLFFFSCTTTKTYTIQPKNDSAISGEVTFKEKKKQVQMTVTASNVSPGLHAIHIHEKADCSAADGTSAGYHWNPTVEPHGKWQRKNHHMGDIGNIVANSKKEVSFNFSTNKWCLGCDDPKKNIMGKGLIIHQDKDDFSTQPTGNSGDRIGCVEIK